MLIKYMLKTLKVARKAQYANQDELESAYADTG